MWFESAVAHQVVKRMLGQVSWSQWLQSEPACNGRFGQQISKSINDAPPTFWVRLQALKSVEGLGGGVDRSPLRHPAGGAWLTLLASQMPPTTRPRAPTHATNGLSVMVRTKPAAAMTPAHFGRLPDFHTATA